MIMYRNIREIEEANNKAGFCFFDGGWTGLLRSKVFPEVFHGKYFISSYEEGQKQIFTIKICLDNGKIESVKCPGHYLNSGFMSHQEAVNYAKNMLKKE